jgi:hypothetical protein
MREFSGNFLEKYGMREFSGNICEKSQLQEVSLSQTGKMFPLMDGNTLPAQKNVKKPYE